MTQSKRRARSRETHHDEPVLDEEDLEWCGDQLIYVIDRTEAGFAYGPTVADMRSAEHDARGAGWARAKHVLRELLEREVGPVRDLGWIKIIGAGVSRDIFAAEVELADGRCDSFVVALPRHDADRSLDERTSRELRLIARLRECSFPFRVPEMIGAFPDDERLALVRRYAVASSSICARGGKAR